MGDRAASAAAPRRRRHWLRWVGLATITGLALPVGWLSVTMLRDPAMRGVPLGMPTPWPAIVLEEAAMPSAVRWSSLGADQPPPAPVRACIAPRSGVATPLFGGRRYCGGRDGQVACPRRGIATPERALACATHATRVAEALLRRGDADGAWAWLTEARLMLGLGSRAATDPALALELSLRIRQLDLDVAAWLPWLPVEEELQARVSKLRSDGDTALFLAVRRADWRTLTRALDDSRLPPRWRTDSVAVAILARSWRGVESPQSGLDHCPGDGRFWARVCGGDLTPRGDRDPADPLLDVAREDARAYRAAQRQGVDSLLADWTVRQPALVPARLRILGSDRRLGRFLLERTGANGLAVPWPRLVVLDVGRSLDRIASTLAHELGHHAQFRDGGVWTTMRMPEPEREADADAWGRAFLCRVGGVRLGRLGGSCPEPVE